MLDFLKRKFGKQEEPEDYTIHSFKKGFIFDYDLRAWEVKECYNYDWGDEFFSREYKVSDGAETSFLYVEEDDELELVMSKKINTRDVYEGLMEYVKVHEQPPKELTYEGTIYYFDEESPGYFQNESAGDEQWVEFISWDYYDKDEKFNLCIEQWDEKSFEASLGKVIGEHEISNILPNP